jgi:predicted cation transporter
MDQGVLILFGLMSVMGLVLFLPFFSKKVEEELEVFLLIMGLLSVSFAGLWSGALVHEALIEPVKISVAVLVAGLLFRSTRKYLRKSITTMVGKMGYGPVLFLTVVVLGLVSSFITAIVAALALAEIISVLRLPRAFEIKVVVIACFAIGLGAVLTPLGEPLATIAIAKLKGEPHFADFFFLAKLLGVWVVPAVLGLGLLVGVQKIPKVSTQSGLREDKAETLSDVLKRTGKVYLFVAALVLLGTGFTPLVEKFLLNLNPSFLYWINITSAVLDNATLAAAEIGPKMNLEMIRYLLLGLLISGGMLIPGNIPNIICANKLSIRSKEWAKIGLPLGIIGMIGYFLILEFLVFR